MNVQTNNNNIERSNVFNSGHKYNVEKYNDTLINIISILSKEEFLFFGKIQFNPINKIKASIIAKIKPLSNSNI